MFEVILDFLTTKFAKLAQSRQKKYQVYQVSKHLHTRQQTHIRTQTSSFEYSFGRYEI